jgi:hypothetical protein
MRAVARRWWFWLIVVIAAAIVIVHIYLAIWVRDYVNRKLSEIPGYRAHVAAVTLHLWRGAYQIHNIDIKKTSGKSAGSVLFRAAGRSICAMARAHLRTRRRWQHRDLSRENESGEWADQRNAAN